MLCQTPFSTEMLCQIPFSCYTSFHYTWFRYDWFQFIVMPDSWMKFLCYAWFCYTTFHFHVITDSVIPVSVMLDSCYPRYACKELRIISLLVNQLMWGWVKYIHITSWNSEISRFPYNLSHDKGLLYHPLIISKIMPRTLDAIFPSC